MSRLRCLLGFILVFILVIGDGGLVAGKKDRVRLTDIQTLTLHADKRTTSRRSSPIQQLTCIGGFCSKADIRTAQCYNRGFDGTDVQWECKADMPSNYKFGKLEVSCEGYDYPDDDYILAGSCGLEYTIDQVPGYEHSHHQQQYSSKQYPGNKSEFSYFPIIVILAIMFLIYYTCLRDTSRTEQNSGGTDDPYGGNDHGGGGGSSWFSGSSPRPSAPPPPGFRPDLFGDSCSGTRQRPSQSSSSGPGFFSGMAAGGLLGYLFGGSGGGNTYSRRRSPFAGTSYYDQPSTSSGYSSSFSSPSSSSSSTHTSTGFASTKRR